MMVESTRLKVWIVIVCLNLLIHFTSSTMITSRREEGTDKCVRPRVSGGLEPSKRLYLIGENVMVRCPTGYRPAGDTRLVCTSGGIWTTIDGLQVFQQPHSQCQALECKTPVSISHGSVEVMMKESFSEKGLMDVGGDRGRDTGMFLGMQQEGLGRGNRFPEGSIAEYSCSPGYCLQPLSHASRTCHHGAWLGELPECVHISQFEEQSSSQRRFPIERRHGSGRGNTQIYTPVVVQIKSNVPDNKSVCQRHARPPQQGASPTENKRLYGLDTDALPVIDGCEFPEQILNGYYLEVSGSSDTKYPPGAQLQFLCHVGYHFSGPDEFVCGQTGEWEPPNRPQCQPLPQLIESELCSLPPEVKNTIQKLVDGMLAGSGAVHGTKVEYRCRAGYRNVVAPCNTHTLSCHQGKWHGTSPECDEFSSCVAPPNIDHGFMYDSASSYPLQSQVYYSCESGYRLMGPSVLTCEETGCWAPKMPPICQRIHHYQDELDSDKSVLDMHTILVATTGSVIGILLIVLALILYQRAVSPKLIRLRNSGSGGDLPPPPHTCPPTAPPPPQDHDPDRVALIAYPDEQGVPPTYEEAVRQRPAVMFEPHGGRYPPHGHRSRGHRVVVPGVRRSRHRDNPDNISYQSIGSARQSSSWSACDSMGSTDTVAVSDSTNVTVETQSSGGTSSSAASQAPSCRALAGSLASFDTSSLVNNEGAPLLEEAEGDESDQRRAEDQYSLSTRDSDSLKDNVSHTRSVNVSLQE